MAAGRTTEMSKLVKELRRMGYDVAFTRNGHYVVRDENGNRLVTFPSTPGDYRGWRNTLADLKRVCGYVPNARTTKPKSER